MKLHLDLKVKPDDNFHAKVLKVYDVKMAKTGLPFCNAVCEHEGQTFMLVIFTQDRITRITALEGKEINIKGAIFNQVHKKNDGGTMLKCTLGKYGRFEAL